MARSPETVVPPHLLAALAAAVARTETISARIIDDTLDWLELIITKNVDDGDVTFSPDEIGLIVIVLARCRSAASGLAQLVLKHGLITPGSELDVRKGEVL